MGNNDCGVLREDLIDQAESFIRLCYGELEKSEPEILERVSAIREEVLQSGTYRHTEEELTHGARMAWRHNSRCIGRLFWHSLEVIDARGKETAEEVAEALLAHMERANNGGRIRPVMTVFRSGEDPAKVIRIWNHQLIRYAGYPGNAEDPRAGDPASDPFTSLCLKLGWQGTGGDFDVLPLVISIGDEQPCLFPIPKGIVQEVPLTHPEIERFPELGLRWYSVPIVSDMQLEIGGIRYTAAPFNGWYMETEIGSRNLGDTGRYNRLPAVADLLGLDRSTNTSLWKDRALLELNRAVLHSYKLAGVSIVDHHTAADQFVRFQEQEKQRGREVSGKWHWLIPPVSPSATPIWNDNKLKELNLSPRLVYQSSAYAGWLEEADVMQKGMLEDVQEGTQEGAREGAQEGAQGVALEGTREGTQGGTYEGALEGTREGTQGGTYEGALEGTRESAQEGMQEGAQEGRRDGAGHTSSAAAAGLDITEHQREETPAEPGHAAAEMACPFHHQQ
ncbi:nitric oxide synthase oxygenase [Paenibacillus borealis]|uniref:nitric oxide synthase oxygenase n=1 Tax=Paenibacillus borealis TaxID=160799 RepID=UPI0009F859B6|nr:nitric oxide synthase oxygenase [Paenibacillus borealis]